MFNEVTINALKNCPDDQIDNVRMMLVKHATDVRTIIEHLTTRQNGIVNLKPFCDSCMTKSEFLETYLKKPNNVVTNSSKISYEDFIKQKIADTRMLFKTIVEPEFVRSVSIPTWIKNMYVTPSNNITRAMSILTDMFHKHVIDHNCLKGRVRSIIRISNSDGFISYVCKVDDVTHSSLFKIFEPHNNISYITLADRIFEAIQSDIAERNMSSKNLEGLTLGRTQGFPKYAAFINSLDIATKESLCIVADDKSLRINFVFQGETFASIQRNVNFTKKPTKKTKKK